MWKNVNNYAVVGWDRQTNLRIKKVRKPGTNHSMHFWRVMVSREQKTCQHSQQRKANKWEQTCVSSVVMSAGWNGTEDRERRRRRRDDGCHYTPGARLFACIIITTKREQGNGRSSLIHTKPSSFFIVDIKKPLESIDLSTSTITSRADYWRHNKPNHPTLQVSNATHELFFVFRQGGLVPFSFRNCCSLSPAIFF